MSAFFEILKSFQVITIKLCRESAIWGFSLQKTNKAAFKKMLTRVWTANGVKYENVIIGAIKHNTSDLEVRGRKTKVGKQGVCSLYSIFEITKII